MKHSTDEIKFIIRKGKQNNFELGITLIQILLDVYFFIKEQENSKEYFYVFLVKHSGKHPWKIKETPKHTVPPC